MPAEFATIAQRIERNPLGRLMYGQRELFHSNLLAWFFDLLPESADAVFRPLTHPGEDSGRWVERERNNLDLVLHWPDRAPLIIENKVFSVPRLAQLDGYEAVASGWGSSPALVLLSVSDPDFDLGHWTHLTYAELADRILEALPAGHSYEVETMRRYAALVRDLHELVSVVGVRSHAEAVWLPDSLLGAISSNQMRAALHKARAHRVARIINVTIPDLEQPASSGMSHATPLVEVLEYVHTQGLDLQLGWQLQGRQFRRAAVFHDPAIKGSNQDSRQQRELVSRKHPEFFAFPPGLPQKPSGRKSFNHFAPNFVYNYVKTPNLTIAELTESARVIHEEIQALRAAELHPGMRSADAIRTAP